MTTNPTADGGPLIMYLVAEGDREQADLALAIAHMAVADHNVAAGAEGHPGVRYGYDPDPGYAGLDLRHANRRLEPARQPVVPGGHPHGADPQRHAGGQHDAARPVRGDRRLLATGGTGRHAPGQPRLDCRQPRHGGPHAGLRPVRHSEGGQRARAPGVRCPCCSGCSTSNPRPNRPSRRCRAHPLVPRGLRRTPIPSLSPGGDYEHHRNHGCRLRHPPATVRPAGSRTGRPGAGHRQPGRRGHRYPCIGPGGPRRPLDAEPSHPRLWRARAARLRIRIAGGRHRPSGAAPSPMRRSTLFVWRSSMRGRRRG